MRRDLVVIVACAFFVMGYALGQADGKIDCDERIDRMLEQEDRDEQQRHDRESGECSTDTECAELCPEGTRDLMPDDPEYCDGGPTSTR